VDAILKRAGELKQCLVDFVLEAEGDLATSLERYSAEQLARSPQQGVHQQDLVVDRFLTEGRVGAKTPIDLFLEQHPDLAVGDRELLQGWHRAFIGLFAVTQVLTDGFEVMNWLTAKVYTAKFVTSDIPKELDRAKLGEILLTRIAPVDETCWMFSGPCTAMGNLGKPKLAVAIGNFKQNYRAALYSDAPELLAEAWQSVEHYHQDFLAFFGSDEVTLSGYQLGKKIAEFQAVLTQKQLAEAGIDESKSLAEIVSEAGVDEAEIAAVAKTMGTDAKAVEALLKSKESAAKMMSPTVELPPELKKAEHVTVLAHPRWGQMFLPTYTQFKELLTAADWQSVKGAEKLVRKYLEDPSINAFIWHRLATEYPAQLEAMLQAYLQRPTFKTERDLDGLLQEHKKPLEPELPDIASVPLHLHNLFQTALSDVSKSKAKDKDKVPAKASKGFQRL